ncbi:unnamed protein product [Orchesella dallaii]|uniref:Centrosomal protein kizuna n=1 Tax=Orchesella dallaii TaxID=48710 RepID=A0ABP1RH71_9HEXA
MEGKLQFQSTMSESGPSSAGDVADDHRLHIQSCMYYQYDKVHRKGLRSEDQVKDRLTKDLLRRSSVTKQTKAAVEEQVSSLMSETGIVSKYLKGKQEMYDSYKPLFKSFCTCDEAKIVKVDKQTDVKEVKQKDFQGPGNLLGEIQLLTRSPVVSNKNEEARKNMPLANEKFQQDFSVNEKREDSNLMEIEENPSKESLRQEVADEKTSDSDTPFTLGTEQPLKPVFDQCALNYWEELGLDLSEDEEDEETVAAGTGTPIGVKSILNNGMKKDFPEDFEDEQKLACKERKYSSGPVGKGKTEFLAKLNFSYADPNPHDELDYDD